MLSGDLSLSLGSFVGPTVEGLAGLLAGDLGLLGIFASILAGSLLSESPASPKLHRPLCSAQGPQLHSMVARGLPHPLLPKTSALSGPQKQPRASKSMQ